ncbi:MAG: hypothetical protein ABWW69_07950 [Pyrodictiaceae archaeon]
MASAERARRLLRLSHIIVPRIARLFKFMGLWLYIPPGVFNPVYTVSTSLIAKHVRPHGRLLDIGSGSGVLAVYFAKSPAVEEAIAYAFSSLRRC